MGSTVFAEEAPADEAPQQVEVKTIKHPLSIPYKAAYTMLSDLKNATGNQVKIEFRVLAKSSKQPIPGLELMLEGENTHQRVPVSAAGMVDVPYSAEAFQDKADFVANTRQEVAVHMFLLPNLQGETFRYGELQTSLNAGKSAMRSIVPWYLRIFMSGPKSVSMCYDQPGQHIRIGDPSGQLRAADVADRDELDRPIYCAIIHPDEPGWSSDTQLSGAPGVKLKYTSKE